MAEFGRHLRKFRHQCNDPKSSQGKLTQERFGELVGAKLGISYSGTAVSDWEREKSKIHANNRPVLIAIVTVLYEYGGIRTIDEANQLLKAGNFRNLDSEEIERVFQNTIIEPNVEEPTTELKTSKPRTPSALGTLFSIPEAELQTLIAKAEEGPSPPWPRVMVALTRRFTDRLSVFQILRSIFWIWVWLLTWVLIIPSVRWPFLNYDIAWLAVVQYISGSVLVPILVGVLTSTSDNKFWREQQGVSALNFHLYTQQGASIGFHLGYFFIFMIGLLLYTFGWRSTSWIELIFAAFMVVLGYASARLVPYNLFVAFKRLSLKDGRIFFIFLLVGPAWGYFFLETYDILLTRSQGIFIVLSSLTILLVMMALHYRQRGTTLIPLRWWVIFWVSFLLCELLLLWLTQVI